MKKIYNLIFVCCLVLFCVATQSININAQNCTTALQPLSVVATQGPASGIPTTPPGTLAQSSTINVQWDPQCGTRAGDGCEFGDNNSLFWYVGIYGQNAPTPNGIDRECGVTAVTLDCPAVAPAVSLVVNNGGDYNGLCLAPKSSTCISSESSQMRPASGGDITSWHTFGDDGTGTLGACDGPVLETTLPICPGQCYNVVVWEFVIDQPSGTGPNADGGAGGTGFLLPFPGMDANISCGNMALLSESPPSDIVSICIDAADGTDNSLIENPTLTVTNSVNGDPALSVCDGLNNAAYTGTFQSQPEDIGDPSLADPCEGSNSDVCNSIDAISDPLTSTGSVDQTIGGNGNGGDAGDISVVLGGAGNSANGALGLGAHVVEVNCREAIGIIFSTPEGCKGFTDQSQFGFPACDFSDGTLLSTNAKVYVSVNGTSVSGVSVAPYPACYAGGSGTGTCATNSGTGYGADYTAQFGNFISEDDTNGQCITNLVGNPFEGSGTNPFTLPGALSGIDFGDGVARDVSTVCVKYEDPCDGSKSITCIKFISDAPPLDAQVAACNETCPGAADGALIVYDVAGGSDDPNADSDYADGLSGAGSYEIDVVAGPVTGQIFTYAGGSSWQATGLPPGVYTIDIRDALAPGDTFDDDADDVNATCGAACTIQRVVEILAGPTLPVVPTVVQPTCDDDGTASIVIDKISTFANGQVIESSGPGTVPGDFATVSTSGTTPTTGLYAGCPSDALSAAAVVEICIVNFVNVTNNSGGDLAGTQIAVAINGSGAPNAFLSNGNAFGGGGSLGAGPVTMCYVAEAGAGAGPDNAGATWASIFAGAPANGLTIDLIVSDGFGTGDTYSYDDITITINDQFCTTEANITAFCDGLGPDNGDGAGGITSADQTLTWASSNGVDAGAEPAFDFITLAGPGENDATFDNQVALDAGVAPGTDVCYSITGYVPGNEFDNTTSITDNQGFLNDLGVGDAAMGCYAGVCCEVTEEVCFTVFPKPLPPMATPVCICEGDAPVALTATGMCDPTSESESGNTDTSIGQFLSPNVAGAAGEVYEFGPPTIPAGCSIASLDITVSGASPNNVEVVDFGNGNTLLAGDGAIFGGPGTYVFSIPGGALNAGSIIDLYTYDDFGVPVTVANVVYTWTYSCPAATPAYTWYGDDGDSDGLLPDPSLGTVVGSGAAYTPAAGDVDMFGVAFDPATCGNYTYCATVDCNGCVGEAECFIYTVNPSPGSTTDLMDEVCDIDAPVDFDLGASNGGGTDFNVYTDAALTTLATGGTVTTGIFTAPDTAPGTYTYYYEEVGADACAFPGFVEDANCVCTFTPGEITLVINTSPADPVGTPDEVCEGEQGTLMASGCTNITWYSDAAGTTMVATGTSYQPADVAVGVYTYYAQCEDNGCLSGLVPVDYTVAAQPTIDTPSLTCQSGPQPLNPMPTGGVYSGSGAGFVVNDQLDPAGQTPGTYDLTYTVGDCFVTIQFVYDTDCDANGGQF